METYFKITASILITLILCLVLSKQKTDFSILLTIVVCGMVLTCAAIYVEPLLELFARLIALGDLPGDLLQILFKVVGIGLISQISSVICIDAGNKTLAKVLQMITTAVILWLCIPLLEQLMDLIENILGVT